MQTQAELFLARAIECEKRAVEYRDGKMRFNLLKLAEYYRSLSKKAKTRVAA
jgi:hypothetical protein